MLEHTPLYLIVLGSLTIVHCVLTHLLRVHEIRLILRISNAISNDPVQKQLQVELVETLIRRVGPDSKASRVALLGNLFRRHDTKRDQPHV